jgi:hypothetical protein
MSEKPTSDPHEHPATPTPPDSTLDGPVRAMASGEYEQTPPEQPTAGESTILRLPEKQRAPRRRHARRAADTQRQPAQGRGYGRPSWGAAILTAVLAASLAAVMTLAITGAPQRLHTPSTQSGRPAQPPPQRPTQLLHRPSRPRPARTATPNRTRASSDRSRQTAPAPPATGQTTRPPSQPVPAQRADSEEQAPGGPFSP